MREQLHPIQVVSRRTGLTPEVLRVWEKRYGVVKPKRTKTARRLYSETDIERLRLLRQVTLQGRRIGEVAALSIGELKMLIQEDQRAMADVPRPGADGSRLEAAGPFLGECLDAVQTLDAPRLEAVLGRAMLALGSSALVEELIVPLMVRIGDLWHEKALSPYREHLASVIVRQTLGQVMSAFRVGDSAPAIVVTTPAGQRHEIGAAVAAATALAQGWRVVYLGPDLPASDIASAAEQAGAAVVALSLVYPADDPELGLELKTLSERLPGGTKLVVGGSAAPAYVPVLRKIGAHVMKDIREFRSFLQKLGGERASGRQ